MKFIDEIKDNDIVVTRKQYSSLVFYRIPRKRLSEGYTLEKEYSGIYWLLRGSEVVYIGKSDKPRGGIIGRVMDHVGSIKEWDSAVVLVSIGPDSLSPIIANLEDRLIRWYHPLLNTKLGEPSHLSELDQEGYSEVMYQVSEYCRSKFITEPSIENHTLLLSRYGFSPGDIIVFKPFPHITATIKSEDLVKINRLSKWSGVYSLAGFVSKYTGTRLEDIKRPESYWRTVEGECLDSLDIVC